MPSAALESFLAEQQDPASPNYRKWVTPEEFADRFGLTAGDIAQVTAWLESQGLKVEKVATIGRWAPRLGFCCGFSNRGAVTTEPRGWKKVPTIEDEKG